MSNVSPSRLVNGEGRLRIAEEPRVKCFAEIPTGKSTSGTAPSLKRSEIGSQAAYNMVAAMNEHLTSSSATNSVRATTTGSSGPEDAGKAGTLGFPCDFDHMYASMTEGGTPATAASALGVSPLRGNEATQNDLTEVKHLKELLLLHLDLIQQQSEQIVTKDKLLAALKQENEMLKLRLERMDRRVNLQKHRSESTENSTEHVGPCSPPSLNSPNPPSTSEHLPIAQPDSVSPQYNESFKIRLNTSGGVTTLKQDHPNKLDIKPESPGELRLEWDNKKKRRSDPLLESSEKRMRGISCSSTISNETTLSAPPERTNVENSKKDKKGKGIRKELFLTTEEHYYTAVGDENYSLSLKDSSSSPSENGCSLEVPSWRVKVYSSCYTMEGTENLDDEIYNKRHSKLEYDERRRKRWDIQRIREQRHIEKLKQRQDRQSHHATCYNTNHSGPCPSSTEEEIISSLWPDIEQIQSLQVDPELPVSAFGAPIPSFAPSEFYVPWLNKLKAKPRRLKRSTAKRKSRR